MVEHVEQRSRNAKGRGTPCPDKQVSHVGNGGPCKHALHVELPLGRQVARDQGEHPEHQKGVRNGEAGGHRGKEKEDGPEKGIERGLYHHSGQDHADAGGCGGMGVGKPEMEREHAHLQPKPCDDARGRSAPRAEGHGAYSPGEYGEVQRTGTHVQKADPQQEKEGTDCSEDKVFEPRLKGLPGHGGPGKNVGADSQYLEEHVEIEKIPRRDDPVKGRPENEEKPTETSLFLREGKKGDPC